MIYKKEFCVSRQGQWWEYSIFGFVFRRVKVESMGL